MSGKVCGLLRQISTNTRLTRRIIGCQLTLFLSARQSMLVKETSAKCYLRLPETNEEAQMDAMRLFRRSLLFYVLQRVTSTEILAGWWKWGDHLTWLAECLLEQSIQQSWHYLTKKHGFSSESRRRAPNATIGQLLLWDKSGGLGIGYDSDLDLVFHCHECAGVR